MPLVIEEEYMMSDLFAPYFKAIKELDVSEATEHTLRGPLESLLKSLAARADSNIAVIHEPKRDANRLGAPDFKFKIHEAILGYLENKKIDESLDSVLQSTQIAKYKQLSNNIVVTNYLEWVWLKDGYIAKRETLCQRSDVGRRRARLDSDKAEKVAGLIGGFLSALPQKLGDAKKLAAALAMRCHDLRDFLREERERQEREPPPGRLYGLYEFFTEAVFYELSLDEFANAFAQTLGYGLFLAKLNAEADAVTLQNAKNHIPANFALIRELVGFLDELERPEYQDTKWLLEEILGIMNALDLAAIHADLAFAKGARHSTEEERLLFDKDPYVYFYEDFLNAYDKATRKGRGVYYTPPPIDAYKKVDGKPLGEKNVKWLQDDYVKFIRFAQWKMEQVEEGIVAIITNHSFLDNPTFRGMRHSLLQTFNQMYRGRNTNRVGY